MKSYEQLARAAFEAHVQEVARQGGFARPLRQPSWDDLQPEFRQGWVAAARAVVAEMATVH